MEPQRFDLGAVLRAHSYMRVERPPELWQVDAYDVPFIEMLGEMIVVGLLRGSQLPDLTLNASNVVVEPGNEPSGVEPGEYVAITIAGTGAWESDTTWVPGQQTSGALASVGYALEPAGTVFAYARQLEGRGSITVWLPRLRD